MFTPMMSRNPDVVFMSEYIKNVLYFATVRQGKVMRSTPEIHYFSTDCDLVYENYYSDFGPLNLGCVYKFCKILNEKLKHFLNKVALVYYTSTDTKKKANAAFLLGCYGVLYLNLLPRDAMKPLTSHGQSYRPFQDATQGESIYTISLLDCLQGIKKARELGFFNFQDFNYEEYQRLDDIQGGDLNWIVPGKFLAFIGPVDYSISLYHPPEMYLDYFRDNNVKIVIRLNKRMYDGNVFSRAGLVHYDLFFPDGTCPPRHILSKFLQISEEADGALAVHCKAGLGRTGSLIGCYLIKHYRMTSHEAISWMRICRPGSVIGHQQGWLEQLEAWLIKQGNLYRKRTFQDIEKLPIHEYGVYSIAEKLKQQPILFKVSAPPSPIQRQTRSEITPPIRTQGSRIRADNDDDEKFEIATTTSVMISTRKGCDVKIKALNEEYNQKDKDEDSTWKRCFGCSSCAKSFNNCVWMLAVRCTRITPKKCQTTFSKPPEKESSEWRVRSPKLSSNQKISHRKDHTDTPTNNTSVSRRSSGAGAGEPRLPARSPSRSSSSKGQTQRNKEKSNDINTKNFNPYPPITTFRTTQGPIIKTLNEARNFLISSSLYSEHRNKQLNSSITVTPHYSLRIPPSYNNTVEHAVPKNLPHNVPPASFSAVSRGPTQPQQRRRLGRSPSPSPSTSPTRFMDQNRATNTPSPVEKFLAKDASKSALREALSRLRLTVTIPRDGSVGAASLGARREAPMAKRAPSVHSDERAIATQGDMLNSIKFQRRFRDTINTGKLNTTYHDKTNLTPKNKTNINLASSRTNAGTKLGFNHNFNLAKDAKPTINVANSRTGYRLGPTQDISLAKDAKPTMNVANSRTGYRLGPTQDFSTPRNVNTTSKAYFSPVRPTSAKGRRNSNSLY